MNLLLDSSGAVSGSKTPKTTARGTSIILFGVKFEGCPVIILFSAAQKVKAKLGGGLIWHQNAHKTMQSQINNLK